VDEERLQLESTDEEDDSELGMSDDGAEPTDQETFRNTLRRGSLASHSKSQQPADIRGQVHGVPVCNLHDGLTTHSCKGMFGICYIHESAYGV
jgi:hypothetical protein